MSSVTLFGGAALKNASQSEADGILDILLKYGVNHIDTAPRYGDSELRIGSWMKRHRKDFFLATKTAHRTYEKARQGIHRSLERLQVEQIDLIQMHALSHPEEWEIAMSAGGALEAFIEAREEGLVRFLGVTGHGWTIPAMHKQSLARFNFDSVLMPYNHLMCENERYLQDFEEVVKICQERQTAVQTIKSIARGPWATTPPTHETWYQPLETQEAIDQAVHWVLGYPGIFLNTVGDMELLPKVLLAASRYEARPSDEDMAQWVKTEKMTSLFGLGL